MNLCSSNSRLFVFSLVIFAALPLTALGNIVQNPGFEADAALLGPSGPCNGTIPNVGADCATVADWSVGGDAGEDTANPNTGSVDAFLGTGTLSQSLTTVAGATYSISYYLAADPNTLTSAADYFLGIGGNNAAVDTSFGADDLGTIDAVNDYFLGGTSADEYVQWSFTDTAASTSTALTFTGFNPDGTWYIDDVDVECTANCGVTPVPEPPAVILLLTALAAGIGLSRIKRAGFRSVVSVQNILMQATLLSSEMARPAAGRWS